MTAGMHDTRMDGTKIKLIFFPDPKGIDIRTEEDSLPCPAAFQDTDQSVVIRKTDHFDTHTFQFFLDIFRRFFFPE